jgi:hypothetical protein
MKVEQVDFVNVPTRDFQRSIAFYRYYMAFFSDPDGTALILHRRYTP